ncbi:hypothetical protein GFS24_16355 [Chitinophaga sp. SYP-B3965]|uniref:DUF922 domain-containing protein n=1 Tax=Chitinophaga sp. SYP-B3965 TaxID=2663120 RepID=UPI001299F74C|nr:hypothetical protein [Chitinophaga sp. SYP-B3965]MRG46695.1 hypothetical protein [Chitinophaga sp. SYP-B3965]
MYTLRISFTLLLLLAPVFLFGQQKMDGLVWAKDVLSWEHFHKKSYTGEGKGIAATYMKMLVEVADSVNDLHKVEVKIYALMIPGLSYVRKGYQTSGTLAHESMHFNILEVFARRLRKELLTMEFDKKTYKKQIERLRRKNWTAVEKAHKQYDKTHRQKEGGHDWWVVDINNSLEELSAYADPVISVVVN